MVHCQTRATVTKTLDNQRLRACLSEFATGVAVITALGRNDEPIGLTVNSFSSVSLDPPLVLWSLTRQSPRFDDYAATEYMAVHVLSADQRELAVTFSTTKEDKFSKLESWHCNADGVPILTGSIAVFECIPWQQYDGGDHVIHVIKVERFSATGGSPLLFHTSQFSALPTTTSLPANDVGNTFVDNYLPYLIGRAGFEVNRSFARQLHDHDVQPAQWRVLATLADRKLTVGELASIVLLKQPTLTKLLDRMVTDELVARENHRDDRRKVVLTVTTKGRTLAGKLTRLALDHEKDIVAQVPALARPEIEQGLRALIQRLGTTQ